MACSNIALHSGGNFIGAFSDSYNELCDKLEFSQPEYFETLSFFSDKSLTLKAQSNNIISGLILEAAGLPLTWFRVDRMIFTEMSVLNGPISQVGTPELSHQAAKKFYVDNRPLSYNPTVQMNLQFEALYTKKSDLQTTDLRMLTLLRNTSQSTVPDPFAFLDYYITSLIRNSRPPVQQNNLLSL